MCYVMTAVIETILQPLLLLKLKQNLRGKVQHVEN